MKRIGIAFVLAVVMAVTFAQHAQAAIMGCDWDWFLSWFCSAP